MQPVKSLMPLAQQLKEYPQSAFGAIRTHDIHTGIDIYCEDGAEVKPMLTGEVVAMGYFTGSKVGSPWWNNTQYVVVKSDDIYILYGEIRLNPKLKLGMLVLNNGFSSLGKVKRVLAGPPTKTFLNPTSMLHIERYTGSVFAVEWKLGEEQPRGLVDPTAQLLAEY